MLKKRKKKIKRKNHFAEYNININYKIWMILIINYFYKNN